MNNLGTIKILENKLVEVWVKTYKISDNYILYKGDYYKLEDNLEDDEELENDF